MYFLTLSFSHFLPFLFAFRVQTSKYEKKFGEGNKMLEMFVQTTSQAPISQRKVISISEERKLLAKHHWEVWKHVFAVPAGGTRCKHSWSKFSMKMSAWPGCGGNIFYDCNCSGALTVQCSSAQPITPRRPVMVCQPRPQRLTFPERQKLGELIEGEVQ